MIAKYLIPTRGQAQTHWTRGMNLFAKSLRLPHLLALLLLGAAGCGLSDYQSRMDKNREWVREFDEANRGLDDPIETPSVPLPKPKDPPKDAKEPAKEEPKEAKPAWLFDVFLRLPKGFGTTPKDKIPYLSPFPCYRYAGAEPGHDILIAANVVADRKAKEDPAIGKYYPEDFRHFVRRAIEQFYAKTNNKLDLKLPDKEKFEVKDFKVLSPLSDSTARVAYQHVVYADSGKAKEPSVFRVYIHEEPATVIDEKKVPGKQIAIIVHRPVRTSNDTFDKAVEACLGTLDTSDVVGKRLQYKKLMKR
jgi:hypothetical protein